MLYFIGTDEQYAALNAHIGTALGLPRDGTDRYAPEEPMRDAEGSAVMPIASNVFGILPEDIQLSGSYSLPHQEDIDP